MASTERTAQLAPAHNRDRGALEALKERIGALLDEMWEKIGKQHVGVSGRALDLSKLTPRADVCDDERAYTIEVELPGVDPKDVEVHQRGDVIVVSGEKHTQRESKGRTYYLCERAFGRFVREFPLPGDADTRRAEARFADGLLTIKVPVKPGARKPARRVPVKAA